MNGVLIQFQRCSYMFVSKISRHPVVFIEVNWHVQCAPVQLTQPLPRLKQSRANAGANHSIPRLNSQFRIQHG